MPGNFAVALPWRRFVTEGQRAQRYGIGETAADVFGRIRIVIARDPDPIASALQRRKRDTADIAHARRTAAVMKTVAQRDDERR